VSKRKVKASRVRGKAAGKRKPSSGARPAILRLRLATDELGRFERAALAKGVGVSTWVRLVALEACAAPAMVNVTRALVRHPEVPGRAPASPSPGPLIPSFDPDAQT
jgi:hypothetical protein